LLRFRPPFKGSQGTRETPETRPPNRNLPGSPPQQGKIAVFAPNQGASLPCRPRIVHGAGPGPLAVHASLEEQFFMTEPNLSFAGRLAVAVGSFFAILGDGKLAANVQRLRNGETVPVAAAPVAAPVQPVPAAAPVAPAAITPQPQPQPAPAIEAANPDSALQLLGLLQRNARFVDFVEEDIAGYSDADIGAAARLVHEGCRTTLREHFTIRPVRDESEGSRVTLPEGFDATAVRLTGNVVGAAPFSGSIAHRGWRVTDVKLPKRVKTHDVTVIAPAEVEL
jgi:hypothetical protein